MLTKRYSVPLWAIILGLVLIGLQALKVIAFVMSGLVMIALLTFVIIVLWYVFTGKKKVNGAP